jgi:hypothetical protein
MVFIFALGFMLENSSPLIENNNYQNTAKVFKNLEYPWAWGFPYTSRTWTNLLIIFGGHLLWMNIPPRRDIIPTP